MKRQNPIKKAERHLGSKGFSYAVYAADVVLGNFVAGVAGVTTRALEDTTLVKRDNRYLNLTRLVFGITSALGTLGGINGVVHGHLEYAPFTASNALAAYRFAVDSGYASNPKNIGEDIRRVYRSIKGK
jgi:hypothetical protein